MSQTLYLKYRPQTFADLDSTTAREELINIFSANKIPHAFLFSGTKGIGKTSGARIVAKAVNCTTDKSKKTQAYEPCNQCDSCLAITNGSNVDVMEIDAASFTGVDDIRELREKIRLAPAGLKYKVFIIDEVHRLSGSAFDALLKTLEEPPSHVIFILCTTDPEKLPKTIISRCHRIAFRKATKKEIIDRLKKICQAEGFEFEEEALSQIVKLSEGSFRDGVKILEQVSFSGKITLDEVNKIAGISGEFKSEALLQLLAENQTKQALLWVDSAVDSGVSLKILLENLLADLRLALLAQFGVEDTESLKTSLNSGDIKRLIDLLNQAYGEMKFSVINQLPLEMAIIEFGQEAKETTSGGNNETKPKASKKIEEVPEEETKPEANFSFDQIVTKWPEILEKVKPLNHSVLAFLKACRPKTVEGNFLVLEVYYKFHKDQLESEKCRQIFEKAASQVVNSEVLLRCELSKDKPVRSEPTPLPPMEESLNRAKAKIGSEEDILRVAEEIFK